MESSTPHLYVDNFTVSKYFDDENEELLIYTQVPLWGRTIIRVYVCMIALVGISGNSLLFTVLMSQKKMSSTDMYVQCLAIADLISLCLSCPYSFVRYSEGMWKNVSSDWICKLHYYTQYVVFLVSLLMISGIAIDRYLRVFKPHTPDLKQRKVASILCVCVYGISILIWIPCIFIVRRNAMGRCSTDGDSSFRPVVRVTFILMVCTAILSLITTSIVYSKIGLFLRRRAKIGVIQTSQGSGVNLPPCPVPGTSNQRIAGKVGHGNNIEMKTLRDITPGLSEANAPTASSRIAGCCRQSRQSSTRTTLIMIVVTIVHFLTRVLPITFSLAALRSSIDLNLLEIYVGLSIMLGKAANPILFAAGSSSFRNRTKDLFKRFI